MKKRPCGMQRDTNKLLSIMCKGRCWPCAFNPVERDRRLREGTFVRVKTGYPPVTVRKLIFPTITNINQEEQNNEQK